MTCNEDIVEEIPFEGIKVKHRILCKACSKEKEKQAYVRRATREVSI